jgi:DinB superfamily
MSDAHGDRIARTTREFSAALDRLIARLESVDDAAAERPRADGGWSAAQIGWHVAAVNTAFAGIMVGAVTRGVSPTPAGFAEVPWSEVAARVARRLNAPDGSRPPAVVTKTDAVQRLRASGDLVRRALAGLTPERGAGFILESPIVGTITINQVGEWATAHVIRHNAQAKALLGR